MTRWFQILAALQGEIKNGEVNCGSGREWSVWASEAPLLLLKTDKKSFVVREVK